MMKTQIESFFSENYYQRYYDLLWIQLILLFLYRISTLVSTTKNLTGIPFFTPNQLIIGFTIFELLLSIIFILKIPKKVPRQNLFLSLLVITIFFLILYIEQFIIPNNPIQFGSDDLVFSIIQFLILLILIIVNKGNLVINRTYGLLSLLIVGSFFFVLLSKMLEKIADLLVLNLIIANIIFWVFLWFIIVRYTKILYKNYNWLALLPILISIFLTIGMFMGMMKSLGNELGKTVFNTINYQALSLHSANKAFFGFNPEILMIIINLLTGYCLLFVLLTILFLIKPLQEEAVVFLILGVTGIAVYPLLVLIRYLAFFKFSSLNEVNTEKLKSKFENDNY